MISQDKAKDLVNTFYYALPNNGSTEGLNSTTRRYAESKQCALIAVEEILGEYQSMSDLESKIVINDEVKFVVQQLVYWMEIKQEIEKL